MLRRLLVGIVGLWPALAAAQGPSAAAPAPATAAAAAVFSGVDRQLQVQPPRLEADIEVDGVLDEPVWQQAARLTGFSRYAPVDGGPADRATDVLVWYSPSALHFGVRATAAADGVQATLADRDKIDADDHVQFFLSTFGDGRQAFVFAVNPFGVQMDGAMVEGSRTGGGGFGGLAQGREDVDRSPDFVFQSRGHLEADGYVVEVRIPFKSLRYQAAADVSWGLHVTRVSPRAGVEESWAPARRDGASFLNQAGALVGMHDLRRGLVLDVNPVATAAVNGAPAAPGASGWNYGWSRPDLGMNVRWGVTDTLTLNGTVNPDFSQVEADAGQFQFDPRQALFFPDKRPFFLDGIEQFATPNNLIYTRRIVAPLAATRLTGRVSKSTSVAYLMAVDDAATSATGRDHPVFNVLRAQRDIGTGSKMAFVYTDRIDGANSNRVAAADTRVVWKDIYSLLLQGAAARTDSGDRSVLAPLWQATFNRAGRRYGLRMQSRGIDPDFQAQSGFISRRGVASINIANQLTTYGAPGAFVERFTSDVVVDGSWVYDDFVAGRPSQDRKLHFNQNLALRGGWRVGGSVLFETFGYDPTLFTDYVIARPTPAGPVYDPYVGTKRLPNRDYVFSFTVPTRKGVTADGLLLWGKDENFYEWSSADIVFANVGATWRPTDQLRIEGRYQLQSFQRRTDGSYVGIRRIPRLKVEYQVSRPIFVRVIAEQNGNFQDTLRDDSRTGFPIYRMDGAGGYVPAARESTRRLRLDWLFSYQPTPGTVFFAGYGTSLQELDDRRGRQPLRRISDGFFLKMSYLFRL